MTGYLIHSGICKSKDDIKMLKSGIWIVDKSNNCHCNDDENTQNRICDACAYEKKSIDSPRCTVFGCTRWCDANAITATAWCSRVFKAPHCQVACLLAVYGIQQGCYWCCEGGNFYKKCLEPFGNILDYVTEPCDPYWD